MAPIIVGTVAILSLSQYCFHGNDSNDVIIVVFQIVLTFFLTFLGDFDLRRQSINLEFVVLEFPPSRAPISNLLEASPSFSDFMILF